jgi:hypothetical protein
MARPEPTPDSSAGPEPPYEPPRLTVLGSLADMTQGNPGDQSDGINPGSLIG